MKNRLLFFFSLLINWTYSQADTTYWPTGQIRMISIMDLDNNHRHFQSFHKNGQPDQVWESGPKGKVGEWTLYYSSGQLNQIVIYEDENPTNYTYRTFFQSGRLKQKGSFKNGVDNYVSYYQHGVLNTTMKNVGKGVRERRQFYENGTVKEIGRYSPSQDGIWTTFYETGELKRTEKYDQGKRIGVWKEYHRDGTVKKIETCVPGTYYRDVKEFYRDGQVKSIGRCNFKHSSKYPRKLGEWKEFHENGEMSRLYQFKDGQETGIWKRFHEDGSLSQQGEYVEGKPIGYWKDFYPDGTLKRIGEYSPNVYRMERMGVWKDYHENGQLKRTVSHYYRGKAGEYREYYDSGEIKLIGYYGRDNRMGEWMYYRKDGSLKRSEEYNEDIIVAPVCMYNSKGNPVRSKENFSVTYKYYENEAISKRLKYKKGKSRYYYSNGNLKRVEKYRGENRKNKTRYFGQNGNLSRVKKVIGRNGPGRVKLFYDKDEAGKKFSSNFIGRRVKSEGKLVDNKMTGEWKLYHKNGNLYQIQVYESSAIMEVKSCFDSKGNALPIGTLKEGNGTVLDYSEKGMLIRLTDYQDGRIKYR